MPVGRLGRYVSQISSSRRSTLSRSLSKRVGTALEIHLPELEPAVGFFEQHLHFPLRPPSPRRSRAEKLDSLLEQLERGVETNLLLFERGQNFVQTPKICFEGHVPERKN